MGDSYIPYPNERRMGPRSREWDTNETYCCDTRAKRKARQVGIGRALEDNVRLREALTKTRDALRLLQPALNTMASECLGDIIEREINAPLAALSSTPAQGEGK